jgi:hypothetical protein
MRPKDVVGLWEEKTHGKIHEPRLSRNGNLDEMRTGSIDNLPLPVCSKWFIMQWLKPVVILFIVMKEDLKFTE